jgi:hypothetical protein
MDRVASKMRTIANVESGRLAPEAATKTIATISQAPASTWLFALAAAAGAVALKPSTEVIRSIRTDHPT